MENYYALLEIKPTASTDEIKQAFTSKFRLWTPRTNAPDLERRQEAERKVKVLQEAEVILLDASKRAEYNRWLAEQEQLESGYGYDQESLIKEGWRLLNEGKIAEALNIGTIAVEQDYYDPDAHDLLGYAHFRWGNIYEAKYECNLAISQRPNVASYYYHLGEIYESEEDWDEALEQYRKAKDIKPQTTEYRAAFGRVSTKIGHYQKSIDNLEQCMQEEPDNASYRGLLAQAYTSRSTEAWTFVPEGNIVSSGYYATKQEQVQDATNWIQKAEMLNAEDDEVAASTQQARNNIRRMLRRRFHGNKVVTGVTIILSILLALFGWRFSATLSWELSAYFLVCSGLYIVSCMTPQYVLARRVINGKDNTSVAILEFLMDNDQGCIFFLVIPFIIALLPVMAIWNFIWNYVLVG